MLIIGGSFFSSSENGTSQAVDPQGPPRELVPPVNRVSTPESNLSNNNNK
jgi:hypothetical protein